MAKLKTDTGSVQVTITAPVEGEGLVMRSGSIVNEPVSVPNPTAQSDQAQITSDISLTDNVLVAVDLDQVNWSFLSGFDLASDANRWTAPYTGRFAVTVHYALDASSNTTQFQSELEHLDSGDVSLSKRSMWSTVAWRGGVHGTTILEMDAADYILFQVLQDSVGTRGLNKAWITVTDYDNLGTLLAGFSPILDHKPTVDTLDDEFDSAILDGKWTVNAGSSGVVDFFETGNINIYDLTTRPGYLLTQAGSAGAQQVRLRQDLTLADGASVIVQVFPAMSMDGEPGWAASQRNIGIALNDNDTTDTSGNSLTLTLQTGINGQARILAYDGTTGRSIGEFQQRGAAWAAGPVYLRFSRSGTNYRPSVSFNGGASWNMLGDTTTFTGTTFTNLWITDKNSAAFSSIVPVTAWGWIRQGTNTLDPWSHSPLVKLADANPPYWQAATIGEYDDYFNIDNSADWTTVVPDTGTATWSYQSAARLGDNRGVHVIFEDQSSGDYGAFIKPLTGIGTTDLIQTAARIFGGIDDGVDSLFGLVFTDGTTSAANSVAILMDYDNGENPKILTGHGTLTAMTTFVANTIVGGGWTALTHLKLTYSATNTFQGHLSMNGENFIQIGANISKTMTPTHGGFICSSFGTGELKIGHGVYFHSDVTS